MKTPLFVLMMIMTLVFWFFIMRLQSSISFIERKNKSFIKKIQYLQSVYEKVENYENKHSYKRNFLKKEIKKWRLEDYMNRDAILNMYNPLITPFLKPIILMIHWEKNEERNNDFVKSLQNNLMNPLIKKVIIFSDKHFDISKFLFKEKITFKIGLPFNHQNILDFSNQYLKEMIVIYSKPDIIYDYSLLNIQNIKNNEIYLISRQRTYNNFSFNLNMKRNQEYENQCYFYNGIHDSIAFISPKHLKYNELFQTPSLQLSNPCNSIILTHLDSNLEKNEEFKYLKINLPNIHYSIDV